MQVGSEKRWSAAAALDLPFLRIAERDLSSLRLNIEAVKSKNDHK